MHNIAGDIREAEIAALEAAGEFFVVQAEEVQEGGVEIVDVNRVAYHVPAEFVGPALRFGLPADSGRLPFAHGYVADKLPPGMNQRLAQKAKRLRLSKSP